MRHYIIDSGHSGAAFGCYYNTPGKRSPEVPPGIYEGEFDRAVSEHLVRILKEDHSIPAEHLTPGPMRPRLKDRAAYVNWLAGRLEKDGHTLALVSIHANADGNAGWSDTNFSRVFHAPVSSQDSIRMARDMTGVFERNFNYPARAPGILNTTLLTKTKCPAILVECGHMTNKATAKFMASGMGRMYYACAIAQGLAE